MIEISPELACMLYVGGLLALLLLVWLGHSQRAKKREIMKFTRTSVVCEYCSSSYLTESVSTYHRCPKCQCLNGPKAGE